tara:strand:+ start:1862 stop:3856 length:1995 start_codon:yes stop_codon:yes gene_type:complete
MPLIENKELSYSFLKELCNLIFFWISGVCFFLFFRISFIFLYRFDLTENLPISEFIKTLYMGFRFDSTVVSFFLIIPFLALYVLPILNKEKYLTTIRIAFQYIFIITSTILCIINLNFYKEFKNQFNHFIFVGFFDDKKAIFQSILYDYNPLTNTFFIIIIISVFIEIFKFYEKKNRILSILNIFNFKHKSLFLKVLFFFLFFASIRGSFTEYPARRFYSSLSVDDFLNKTIINPLRSLSYAVSDYNELNKIGKENPFGEISLKLKEDHKTFKEFLKKDTSYDNLDEPPDQIFLVVMESYDSWILKDDYDALGVSKSLKGIENNGVSFKNFIPSANSTMNSLGAIISGVPYCGINISKIGALRLFDSSIFSQFKKLGYETNIFFTTYSSWQNLGNFAKGQGVDNVYDGTSGSYSKGVWGINDENLFNNVLEKVDSKKKSINIIITISYHSPFEEEISCESSNHIISCSYKDWNESFSFNLSNSKIKYDKRTMPAIVLGHLWFADRSIGAFIKKAENIYKKALFAFTGDHFSRRFLNASPDLMERSSVPFIIYGPSLKDVPEKYNNPGSHIDITPTLIELVAPKNFTYYSFGNSLLKNKKNKIGIGFNKTIQKEVIHEFSKNNGIKEQVLINYFPENKVGSVNKKLHDSLMSLAWHYTVKGDTIK